MKYALILLVFFLASTTIACKSSKSKKRSYIRSAYLELKDSFPNSDVVLLHDSIQLIFPENIMFNLNSADLLPSFQSKLNRFCRILNKYNKTNILTTGHTDNSGEESFNMKLSNDRAVNVKQRMIEQQVQEGRIFTWGLGDKSPILPNTTAEGRAKNRRVEFVILFAPKT